MAYFFLIPSLVRVTYYRCYLYAAAGQASRPGPLPVDRAPVDVHSRRRATREPTGMPISAPIGPHFTDIR